ncbi:SIS domain-containing protein [bacterium]|nr:SIS domain-containing protein [bacterium]
MTPDSAIQFLKRLDQIRTDTRVTSQGRDIPLAEGLGLGVDLLRKSHRLGHKLMFIGNGGSAAIASHLTLDFWRAAGFNTLGFNDPSQLTCMANDFGFENVFAEPIRRDARLGDVLVAISSSGKSPNILIGTAAAKKKGCAVITFSGFEPANPLRSLGDLNFYVPSASYALVEIAHLALLGAMMEESIARGKSPAGRKKSAPAVR